MFKLVYLLVSENELAKSLTMTKCLQLVHSISHHHGLYANQSAKKYANADNFALSVAHAYGIQLFNLAYIYIFGIVDIA